MSTQQLDHLGGATEYSRNPTNYLWPSDWRTLTVLLLQPCFKDPFKGTPQKRFTVASTLVSG